MSDVTDWLSRVRIGVIGLGYVGLPLAVELGKRFPVIGFDTNLGRIEALRGGHDVTLEIEPEELIAARQLSFSSEAADLAPCNVYIVTVPTPIDPHNRPDLTPLLRASETVGSVLTKGDTVIYESTVYPGCTEGDCVPVLEAKSGEAAGDQLDLFLARGGIVVEDVTAEHIQIARKAWRRFGRGPGSSAGLNYGDCFSYALAKAHGEELLYKGGDFGETDVDG